MIPKRSLVALFRNKDALHKSLTHFVWSGIPNVSNNKLSYCYLNSLNKHLSGFAKYSTLPSNKLEADDYRNQNRITVYGSDVPEPIQELNTDFFPDYIKEYLKSQQFENPTIIQAQGWPIAASGKNLVGIAQTGTGKTLAYLLPAVMMLKASDHSKKFKSPSVLILAPTRELVQQIYQVAQTFRETFKVRSVCVFGGAAKSKQMYELSKGADILIATPGRLIDFLRSDVVNLVRCKYLVLDEADRMLDMGFEPQIREIVEKTPDERQVLMWSATWPKEVQRLAKDYLKEYVQVNVGSTELSANHNIKQIMYVCDESEKTEKLYKIMHDISADNSKVLIFSNTKRTVDEIAWKLQKNGWKAVGIHGDKSQSQRDAVLERFKSGHANILVASDVAARGLDVDGIKYVINYDFPTNSEDYIHRIGRTGRSHNKGTSFSLLTEENARQAKEVIDILIEAKQEVPEDLKQLADQYDADKEEEMDRKRREHMRRNKSRNSFRTGSSSYNRQYSNNKYKSGNKYQSYNNRYRDYDD